MSDEILRRHDHKWKTVVHLDGCHFYSTTFQCSDDGCQATRSQFDERDFKEPYSMAWAMDDCKRCNELLDGAMPEHSDEIAEPA